MFSLPLCKLTCVCVSFFKFQSQAKSIAEQKRFPFATDNDSTNEELGETSVGGAPVVPPQICDCTHSR